MLERVYRVFMQCFWEEEEEEGITHGRSLKGLHVFVSYTVSLWHCLW